MAVARLQRGASISDGESRPVFVYTDFVVPAKNAEKKVIDVTNHHTAVQAVGQSAL